MNRTLIKEKMEVGTICGQTLSGKKNDVSFWDQTTHDGYFPRFSPNRLKAETVKF